MKNAFDIVSFCAAMNGKNEDYTYTYSQILAGVFNKNNHCILDIDETDILDALESIAENISDDFDLEFDGHEYRIIHNAAIWNIYVEEIKRIVEDCYELNLDKIPAFIALSIDWEATAHNTYADGYGHTFATYDGEETQTDNGQYWIFRTN